MLNPEPNKRIVPGSVVGIGTFDATDATVPRFTPDIWRTKSPKTVFEVDANAQIVQLGAGKIVPPDKKASGLAEPTLLIIVRVGNTLPGATENPMFCD